ncbi:L,D-transpeptidase family protein [Ilumatobacter sp.]|uniref:L,D-transpeptidase family protein n=1 Tax=Ilumatobacter sp. TaxID=1967498 RepID=UPI003AF46FDF
MVGIRRGALLGASLLALAACSQAEGAGDDGATTTVTLPVAPIPSTVPPTTPATTPPTSIADEVDGGRNPDCIVTVGAGDSLSKIADGVEGVTLEEIRAENWLGENHVIHPDDELDVCVGNDIDDVRGTSRTAPEPAAVRRQQQELNELFAPYRMLELAVDGDSGKLTRQMICAARMGLGLPVSTGHLAEGSAEEEIIFAAEELSIPAGAATWADKWVLIDETCQVMFTGEADRGIVDVYPTSTGEPDFETHNVQAVAAFRYNPAVENGGWHDSSRFPSEVDNPQNGNMYKPIYFNNGQAIHGANYVPPFPRSKGCARMFTWHQDELIDWLDLDGISEPTWQPSRIGVTVTVQGSYRPID